VPLRAGWSEAAMPVLGALPPVQDGGGGGGLTARCSSPTSSRRLSWSPEQCACRSGGGGRQGFRHPCRCRDGRAQRRVRASARVRGGSRRGAPGSLPVWLLLVGATNVYTGILAGKRDASTPCATARPRLRLSCRPFNYAITRRWGTRDCSCSPSERWSRSARRSRTSTRGGRRVPRVASTKVAKCAPSPAAPPNVAPQSDRPHSGGLPDRAPGSLVKDPGSKRQDAHAQLVWAAKTGRKHDTAL